jgi:predicted CopG family antitoxin
MPTTIQISERTLEILKKVKDETKSSSYDEAINKIVASMQVKESLAGFLGKKMSREEIVKGIREIRDNDRF